MKYLPVLLLILLVGCEETVIHRGVIIEIERYENGGVIHWADGSTTNLPHMSVDNIVYTSGDEYILTEDTRCQQSLRECDCDDRFEIKPAPPVKAVKATEKPVAKKKKSTTSDYDAEFQLWRVIGFLIGDLLLLVLIILVIRRVYKVKEKKA